MWALFFAVMGNKDSGTEFCFCNIVSGSLLAATCGSQLLFLCGP